MGRSVHHLSQLGTHCGITPKEALNKLPDKPLIRSVYNLELILYIRLKGICGESSRKGCILSDLGRKVLDNIYILR